MSTRTEIGEGPALVWRRARDLLGSSDAAGQLGAAFESSLSPSERRRRGVHFSPAPLARRLVARAVSLSAPSAPLRLLDPAMGGGALLVAALDELRTALGAANTPASRLRLARGAFGVDRDPRAVEIARAALWCWVGQASLSHDTFDAQLVCADALLDELAWEPFDVVVGNPPFLGGKRLSTALGGAYAEQLVGRYPGTSRNVDLAGFFLRRAFELLRPGGVLSLIVTNSISQGATRRGGLARVLEAGGRVVCAERRVPWPGDAGVVVSLLHLRRGETRREGRRRGEARDRVLLDGQEVASIDSHLAAMVPQAEPAVCDAMRGRAFIGCFLRGKGFVWDDVSAGRTLADAERLQEREPAIREFIHPFLGGAEVLAPRAKGRRRLVVKLPDDLEEAELRLRFPLTHEHLARHVRPERERLGESQADRQHRARWWLFANTRPRLFSRLAGLSHLIVIPRMSRRLIAARVGAGFVPSDQLVVVTSASHAVLALLSSALHATWAGRHSSTLGDGLRYTPQTAFETFPLPWPSFEALEGDAELGALGRELDAARAELELEGRRGLTEIYRAVDASEVWTARVRSAHEEIDRVVHARYGLTGVRDEERLQQLLRRALAGGSRFPTRQAL